MIKFLVFQFGLEFRFEGFAASGVRSQVLLEEDSSRQVGTHVPDTPLRNARHLLGLFFLGYRKYG